MVWSAKGISDYLTSVKLDAITYLPNFIYDALCINAESAVAGV